jgi:hypothetical protein
MEEEKRYILRRGYFTVFPSRQTRDMCREMIDIRELERKD